MRLRQAHALLAISQALTAADPQVSMSPIDRDSPYGSDPDRMIGFLEVNDPDTPHLATRTYNICLAPVPGTHQVDVQVSYGMSDLEVLRETVDTAPDYSREEIVPLDQELGKRVAGRVLAAIAAFDEPYQAAYRLRAGAADPVEAVCAAVPYGAAPTTYVQAWMEIAGARRVSARLVREFDGSEAVGLVECGGAGYVLVRAEADDVVRRVRAVRVHTRALPAARPGQVGHLTTVMGRDSSDWEAVHGWRFDGESAGQEVELVGCDISGRFLVAAQGRLLALRCERRAGQVSAWAVPAVLWLPGQEQARAWALEELRARGAEFSVQGSKESARLRVRQGGAVAEFAPGEAVPLG